MSEVATIAPPMVSEKPVHADDNDLAKFPPFPEPTNDDFDDDVEEEEKEFFKTKFPDLNTVKNERLHCTACDRHLGCSARNESRMRSHPMLRTLMCHTCHSFYNSGEFDKGDDGSELYCRWCGQGGQVYCCSDCPIVFCAKCIKRNFGMPKIKEIENTDDWKCFKCNPRCLWDLRAVCWALLRFCDLRNKITYKTQDPTLKEAYQKLCAIDESECCKNKNNKKKEKELKRKSESDAFKRSAVTKLPPSIQVRKFASMSPDDSPKEKKKRPLSPKLAPKHPNIAPKQVFIPNRLVNPISIGPFPKKIRLPPMTPVPNMRFQPPNNTYSPRYRARPQPPMQPQIANLMFNNFNNHVVQQPSNDNINLSLESLTQGLDMAAIATLAGAGQANNNDVVCTPDFPLEPLCEVTEEANDDDVECITPAPTAKRPPPIVPRSVSAKDLVNENIVQMTEDDVTVNEATGGLKFRVDPQTLSSNKMYRLPDGRVFAIHANPNMPGGYSATIVAVSDGTTGRPTPRGSTFAAKLSAVPAPAPAAAPSPPARGRARSTPQRTKRLRKQVHATKSPVRITRGASKVDLKVPVEWYRYNLIDAVDALEYSLSRLQKLKKEATTMYLRSRSVEEMHGLTKTLDNLLKTSATRFNEIRDNLNSEVKQFTAKKVSASNEVSDDDDVEILNDHVDDPIFIDENSLDSTTAIESNCNVTNEVDLTGPASSEHNDSGEKSVDSDKDPLDDDNRTTECIEDTVTNKDSAIDITDSNNVLSDNVEKHIDESAAAESAATTASAGAESVAAESVAAESVAAESVAAESVAAESEAAESPKVVEPNTDPDENSAQKLDENDDEEANETAEQNASEEHNAEDIDGNAEEINGSVDNEPDMVDREGNDISKSDTNDVSQDNMDESMVQDKNEDADMSEDLIDSLLNYKDIAGESANMEIPEDFQEP